ncbi:hypothetical protein GGR52DRAFT_555448 [Hypoxylon sp. FL1284]|nr:hypothetical protein GGR52DRAFT_555448 [Hypoxylon sp. FL1284]
MDPCLRQIDIDIPFKVFCWRKGERSTCFHDYLLKGPEEYGNWDLCIIAGPPPDKFSRDSCRQYEIPDEFWSGVGRRVTHDFGVRRLSNGTCLTWIHFLCPIPVEDVSSEPEWLRSSLVLKSRPSPTGDHPIITLILFQPPSHFFETINRLHHNEGAWEDVLIDPYYLVNAAFKNWYRVVDKQAWNVLEMARNEEIMVFKQSSSITAPGERGLMEINYSRIHHRAKDALHLIEAVEAVLLTLECALGEHADMERDRGLIWKIEHDKLRHRKESFRSTRLQLSSIDQRLKNVINLAFNIGTLRDSQVMREDSYVMKTLTMIALIFLPIGTISTVFGSQFFGTGETDLPDGSVQHSTFVTPQFWIFWVITIPATILLLLGWTIWVKKMDVFVWKLRDKLPRNVA